MSMVTTPVDGATRRPPERAHDGGRAAFLVQAPDDVGRLLRLDRTRWQSVTVVAMPAWQPLAYTYAPLSGRTTSALVHRAAVDEATLVAREAACALPPHIAGRHLVYESWRAPAFLASLREGTFDVALFAAWPPWAHRRAVVRAARAGGIAVVRVGRQPTPRNRFRVTVEALEGSKR
jgi:hypothetical protein